MLEAAAQGFGLMLLLLTAALAEQQVSYRLCQAPSAAAWRDHPPGSAAAVLALQQPMHKHTPRQWFTLDMFTICLQFIFRQVAGAWKVCLVHFESQGAGKGAGQLSRLLARLCQN
jgi:hypothetical protein